MILASYFFFFLSEQIFLFYPRDLLEQINLLPYQSRLCIFSVSACTALVLVLWLVFTFLFLLLFGKINQMISVISFYYNLVHVILSSTICLR